MNKFYRGWPFAKMLRGLFLVYLTFIITIINIAHHEGIHSARIFVVGFFLLMAIQGMIGYAIERIEYVIRENKK